jgi:hypothetical protein
MFAVALLAPVAAFADTGVSIDLGSIDISQKLSRGGTYQLPTMGVRNPGTERASYAMTVNYVRDQKQREPDGSWFTFTPDRFTLEPGTTQPVRIQLDIPTGARPDDYLALLEARLSQGGDGAKLGAGAAAKLTFTVKPSNFLQAWQLKTQTWASDHSPWSYAVPILVALLLVMWFLVRRFELRVSRRSG